MCPCRGRHSVRPNFYIIEGAQSWTMDDQLIKVDDQLIKQEIILQGAAWGHLHDFLIERELRDARLLSIAGRHLKGGRIELTAARPTARTDRKSAMTASHRAGREFHCSETRMRQILMR
jgi:hypothetical protein